jgi:hypothetical protein
VKDNNRKVNEKRDIQNKVGRATLKVNKLDANDPDHVMMIEKAVKDVNEAISSKRKGGDNTDTDTPTPTSPKKRGSAAKPSSNLKGKSSSANTPSKAAPSSPKESPPLSLKRKRRSITAKNYAEGDEISTEDSNGSEFDGADDDTPRAKRSTVKRVTTIQARGDISFPTPANRLLTIPRNPTFQTSSGSNSMLDSSSSGSGPYIQSQDAVGSGSDGSYQGVSGPGFNNHSQTVSDAVCNNPFPGNFQSGFTNKSQVEFDFDFDFDNPFQVAPGSSGSAFNNQSSVAMDLGYNGYGGVSQNASGSGAGLNNPSQVTLVSQFNGYSLMPSGHAMGGRSRGSLMVAYLPHLASDNGDSSRLDYKLTLCQLLQVPNELASHYTLEELRLYARAYNRQFAANFWELTGADGQKYLCKGFRLYPSHGATIPHFCYLNSGFAYLAVSRGDLNNDCTINHNSRHRGGFSTGGDALLNMALGVIENTFGLHAQYHPDPRYHADNLDIIVVETK